MNRVPAPLPDEAYVSKIEERSLQTLSFMRSQFVLDNPIKKTKLSMKNPSPDPPRDNPQEGGTRYTRVHHSKEDHVPDTLSDRIYDGEDDHLLDALQNVPMGEWVEQGSEEEFMERTPEAVDDLSFLKSCN
jgi:hypothetical protein